MKKTILSFGMATLLACQTQAQHTNTGYYQDLMADTWVATDAVGRTMPSAAGADQRRMEL